MTVVRVLNPKMQYSKQFRDIVFTKVQTLAVSSITFYVNDTPFHDEYLAFRIGMCPVNGDPENGDLEIEFEGEDEITTGDFGGFFLDPDILISTKGRLKIKIVATPGSGENHSKWCPVSVVTDTYMESCSALDVNTIEERAVALM